MASQETTAPVANIMNQPAPNAPARLLSLDAFRGLTMLLMVLVNNGGGPLSYGPLNHSAWNGWTITDTVFPSFLWIAGVAITLALGRRLESGDSRGSLLKVVFRRAVIIYFLGLLVYAFPNFSLSHQRLLGVLQRIAICYLIAAVIYLYSGVRGQIIWIVGLFAVYWLLMAFANVPGWGPGNLSEEGNFAHYIDSIVLGQHNYHNTKTWDPEGIVSTLPAIGTALLGVMAGHILRLIFRWRFGGTGCWWWVSFWLFLAWFGTSSFPSIRNFGPIRSLRSWLVWISQCWRCSSGLWMSAAARNG